MLQRPAHEATVCLGRKCQPRRRLGGDGDLLIVDARAGNREASRGERRRIEASIGPSGPLGRTGSEDVGQAEGRRRQWSGPRPVAESPRI
eukprot:8134270-Pyramimonas_sp.AAC.1